MTLGGLALAVGILVDDATVTIENIERVSKARAFPSRWHFRRRSPDCRTGLGLYPLYLYRFSSHVSPGRGSALSFRAPGRSRGVRHAGLVRPLANASSYVSDVSIEGQTS